MVIKVKHIPGKTICKGCRREIVMNEINNVRIACQICGSTAREFTDRFEAILESVIPNSQA